MKTTGNLGLKKPDGTDIVDIADLNSNMDTLDTEVTKLASTTVPGRMSAADKVKLNGIAAGANNYTHPTGDGNLHVPATGTGNNGKVLKAGSTAGSAAWGNVAFSEVSAKPTTLSGYGITDAASSSHVGAGGAAHANATPSVDGFMSAADKGKLDGIQAGANNYTHPATHPASIIAQDANNRFMTDAERTKLSGIAAGANNYTHPATHPASIITQDASNRFMTDVERTKLSGIAAGANNYTHPSTHPATIIVQDSNNRFVTDTEKSTWNGKAGTTVATISANGLMSAEDKQLSANRNGYGTTAGTGSAYTLSLNPAPMGLVEGLRITVKIHVANTGTATINVNGLGSKSILKGNGSTLSLGNLKPSSVYSLVYNGTAFILQGEGGDYYIGDTINSANLIKTGESAIELWSNTGTLKSEDMALDLSGNIYVAYSGSSGRITKMNSNGVEIWSNIDVPEAYGISVAASGYVYSTHNLDSGKTLRKLNPSGDEVWSNSLIPKGYKVVVDASENVYCSYNLKTSGGKTLQKLNSSGTELWSKYETTHGGQVAIDSFGNVFIAQQANFGSFKKYTSNGSLVWSFDAGGGKMGASVATDTEGNAYCGVFFL